MSTEAVTATSNDVLMGLHATPEEFLQAAMEWHFSSETGSPFWLERASSLQFNPRTDVKNFDDLSMFPNFADDLREARVEDLIPKGYRGRARVIGVFESGGTTGPSKRVVVLRDWLDQVVSWLTEALDQSGVPRDRNWLALVPSGPHMVGDLWRRVAAERGGLWLPIDLDPRWVKKLVAAGKFDEVEAYTEHLIDQAESLAESQDIGVLMTTPPMLDRICRRESFVELIRHKVESIQWGGAHMTGDSRQLYIQEIFPEIKVLGGYANTMAIGAGGVERRGTGADQPCIFDGFSPFVTFSVVDPSTGRRVALGERGQVIVNHVSKSFFLPNNRERDLAIRCEPPAGHIGDSIADVEPVAQFSGEDVIEGVY